jgi:hypothetical protein
MPTVVDRKLFNGMTRRQRIEFLEEAVHRVRRELNIVSMQWLAITASSDAANYPRVKSRRCVLLKTMDLVLNELEILYEEEEVEGCEGR